MFWTIFCDLCRSIGKSPNAVGAEIGVSSAMITKYKAGSTPRGTTLARIATYFGVPSDFLLGIKATPAPVSDDRSGLVEEIKQLPEPELIQMLEQLSDDNLVQLRDYVRYLLWKQVQDGEARP